MARYVKKFKCRVCCRAAQRTVKNFIDISRTYKTIQNSPIPSEAAPHLQNSRINWKLLETLALRLRSGLVVGIKPT